MPLAKCRKFCLKRFVVGTMFQLYVVPKIRVGEIILGLLPRVLARIECNIGEEEIKLQVRIFWNIFRDTCYFIGC